MSLGKLLGLYFSGLRVTGKADTAGEGEELLGDRGHWGWDLRPEFQSVQLSERSKKRHDPSSQLFENWKRQTKRRMSQLG